jgi:uncharacterized membrane protein
MKDQQTIAQFLKVKDFPFVIEDKNGKRIYRENSNGFWSKCEYDDRGNEIRFENSYGYWIKWEHDDKGNEIYSEHSNGFWNKSEYDDQGNRIYSEDSDGYIVDERPKPMIELTIEDIAKLKGVGVDQIRIKE